VDVVFSGHVVGVSVVVEEVVVGNSGRVVVVGTSGGSDVVTSVVVVVFTGLPLKDSSYLMFQTTPSRHTFGSQQQVPARKR
jgi:hypothetical protein